jgi:ABC-type cobalamin transport system ATPase subunit
MDHKTISAIEHEQLYSKRKYNSSQLTTKQWMDVERYLHLRLHQAKTDEERLHEMRKIAATCASAMDQAGAVERSGPWNTPRKE